LACGSQDSTLISSVGSHLSEEYPQVSAANLKSLFMTTSNGQPQVLSAANVKPTADLSL
jgi:hypothetical protein